ncbi:hypothetical protein HN873_017265 [Arachis hypogaea]
MQVPSYCYWPIGELAASAPILQFEDIVPLETFYDIVSSDIKRESSTCFNYIKQSWNDISSIGQTRNGLVQLSNTCHFCRPLNKTDDLWNWLVSANSFLAMVDYPYPANFMMPLPGHPIKEEIDLTNGCMKNIGGSGDSRGETNAIAMAEEQALLFTCVNCSHGNFFERARLEQHSKQKHDNYEYFCEKCSNCFETKASLTQHIGECRHWDGHRPPPEQKAWASIEDYFSKISGIKEQQQNSKRSKSKVLWSWRKSIKDARSTNNNAKSPKKGIYEFNRVAVTRSTNNNAKSQSSFNKLHIYPKVFSAAIDSYAFSKISN